MIRDTSSQDSVITASQWQKHKRLGLWGAGTAVFIVAAVVMLTAWRSSSQSVNMSRLRIAAVSHGTLVRDASVNGKIIAAISPTLFSSAIGTVTLKVKAGDTVKKGDVLAELESPDITEALKREQSSYEQLEDEVARQKILANKQKLLAQRDADQAEIERISAERAYQRIENAGVIGVVSKNDFLKAQDALKSAEIRSKHAAAAAGLENEDVQLELKSKVSQLDRQKIALGYAQRRVDALQLRAPVDGFIGTLSVSNRTVVAANVPLMTLVDLSQLEVEVEIPETYVADLGLGMNAEISIGDSKVMGKLSSMSPEVANNQVLARIRFDGAQPTGLRQSQRVTARLLIEEKPNVMLVQRGPFLEQLGGRAVYVVNNGIAEKRSIKIGATSVTSVQILEGLKDGDQVVIAGSDAFENANRVSINN
ncbi:efflux RND transporter periplasmic adaptor subunit [Solimicrobium silvestre]|uniref:Efflux transporter, RND family, MFP subunit n=1 Tax=Solimicrobium silvestre TaxID=2099400 RepID=A0A2S9H3R6_9BURK|nr:efflux RND transporter periplasmic adaptor subunit [Solimicrobium silvestre]PRC94619.1 Efflux transporter, RND family, MFP subunit [Solimicrobium silvestre]